MIAGSPANSVVGNERTSTRTGRAASNWKRPISVLVPPTSPARIMCADCKLTSRLFCSILNTTGCPSCLSNRRTVSRGPHRPRAVERRAHRRNHRLHRQALVVGPQGSARHGRTSRRQRRRRSHAADDAARRREPDLSGRRARSRAARRRCRHASPEAAARRADSIPSSRAASASSARTSSAAASACRRSTELRGRHYGQRDILAMYPTIREDHLHYLQKWGFIRPVFRNNADTFYAFSDLTLLRQVHDELQQGIGVPRRAPRPAGVALGTAHVRFPHRRRAGTHPRPQAEGDVRRPSPPAPWPTGRTAAARSRPPNSTS